MNDPRPPRRSYHSETRLIHGRLNDVHWDYRDHIVPPISASAAYRLESAERGAAGFQEFANPELDRQEHAPIYVYDRLDEPTRSMLEEALADAEKAEVGVCFSTGMAAISAALGVLARAGDRIVAHRALYGCTWSLMTNWLPRFGVTTVMADLRDPNALAGLLNDEAVRVVYLETPTNPTLEVIDLAAVRHAVDAVNRGRRRGRKAFVVVDNTFATPFCQRPIENGADLVCDSLTKNIGGFGTDMGGVVVGPRSFEPDLLLFRKDFGAPLAPRSAWPPLVYGLPTLAVRSRQQIATALAVARRLEGHPAIDHVIYPGLESHPDHAIALRQMRDPDGNFAPGIVIAFVVKGAPQDAQRTARAAMNHLADHSLAVTLAVSLGQIRTLIEHPSSMTHATIPVERQLAAGIEPGLVRLSVGLEPADDIVNDLEEALASAVLIARPRTSSAGMG
jgi:cystathionine beta-lyase/cystathionine gamma-synthase